MLTMGCAGENPGEKTEPADPAADRATTIDTSRLDSILTDQLDKLRLPGVSVAIVDRSGVLYSAGYGWADIEAGVPMSGDSILNIASISKTVTALAVLQLRDQGHFGLDDHVGRHLPFDLRHPAFPEAEITIRQLLTHTSGIADGEAYDASYACGDPAVPLATWIRGYLEAGGPYYDADQNFLSSAPGEARSYSNLGFGLLGYLVELISGEGFADYVKDSIFEPLGMRTSSFYLSEIDPSRHAMLYSWVESGETLDNPLFGELDGDVVEASDFIPNCLYSFYNLPDGLVRTSVNELGRYLIAHLRGGEIDGRRIVAESTIEEMLSPQLSRSLQDDESFDQGLAWGRRKHGDLRLWGHGGADPGVRTHLMFSEEVGRGVILFTNRSGDIQGLLDELAEVAGLSGGN